MTTRVNYHTAAPQAMAILFDQEKYLKQTFSESDTLSLPIWELVKLRISQLNQCAFCINMHAKEALEIGISLERIYGLNAWRDMGYYSEAERQALAWAELLVTGGTISTSEYRVAESCFGGKALVDLTLAVNAINSWNRISKAFKPEVAG